MFYGDKVLNEEPEYKELSEAQILEIYSEYEDNMVFVEEYLNEQESILTEGANIDITKKFKDFKIEYTKHTLAGRKCLLKFDSQGAYENFEKARKVLNEFKKEVENMDSDTGSAVFGTIAGILMIMVSSIIKGYSTFVPLLAGTRIYTSAKNHYYKKNQIPDLSPEQMKKYGIATTASKRDYLYYSALHTVRGIYAPMLAAMHALYKVITNIKEFIKRLKSDDSTENKFNLYRTELLTYIKEVDKSLNKLNNKAKAIKDMKEFFNNLKKSKKEDKEEKAEKKESKE